MMLKPFSSFSSETSFVAGKVLKLIPGVLGQLNIQDRLMMLAVVYMSLR